jgi:hypothetical protein
LELAESATDPSIAQIHRRMAENYLELAQYAAEVSTQFKAVTG